MSVPIHNEIQIKTCHFSFAVRKTIYFIVSYDILHKCDVEVFKKGTRRKEERNKNIS